MQKNAKTMQKNKGMRFLKQSKKQGNLEARICNKSLGELKEGDIFTIEIVRWHKNCKYCWTLAYFDFDEDFNLVFCGGRAFKEGIDMEAFMQLAKSSYNYLKALYNF